VSWDDFIVLSLLISPIISFSATVKACRERGDLKNLRHAYRLQGGLLLLVSVPSALYLLAAASVWVVFAILAGLFGLASIADPNLIIRFGGEVKDPSPDSPDADGS